MDRQISHGQALLDALQEQRNHALNEAAQARAELVMAKAEIEALKAHIQGLAQPRDGDEDKAA